ncbi:hypothetical protein PRK78_004468 [Emydomyces testavorans]|uniref:chitinase n=1 Tax=Emydomyces testavorans TaxID=2070801 RepID=A0AAF0DLK6_9EURO|nr:hypothetical protein PRK78_004468 [Emydomyces testavorans]
MFFSIFGAVGLLLSADFVVGHQASRHPAGPSYIGRDACPARCSTSGPDFSKWPVYRSFSQFQSCQQSLFYYFNLHDNVDDANTLHRIYACTSYGPDWVNMPKSTTNAVKTESTPQNVTFEVGWWSEGGKLATGGIHTLSRQLREYLANGYGPTNETVLLFAQSAQAAVGLYIGRGLQNEGVSSFAFKTLESNVAQLDPSTSSLAVQLCEPGYDGDHIFGFMATSNGTFSAVQHALKTWTTADCLSLPNSKNFSGAVQFTTPRVMLTNSTTSGNNSTIRSRLSECRTIQVQSGDSCGSLATKCGISPTDITKFNPAPNFCSTLKPLQHICCSSGELPDFKPKPNPDGSCHTYQIQSGDSCSSIAAANSLTIDDLENFNKKTWGWNGCSNIWAGTIACLSTGAPPMPAPVANAICGPQVPGTKAPTDGSDIAKLNPCPLNACCDVWGQCGITDEFCTDTGTGAPGTARPGTNGCISNCGTTIVRGDAPAVFRKIGYFEGYGFSSRNCLYQEALQIDSSQYTHLHFAFGLITPDYQINTGDTRTSYEFSNFKRIQGPKKILSFGGWSFSTDPSTYNILRQGVTPANRLKLATNIANFIKANNLDGVDIDWEYPSAPDIPNIPPGAKEEGTNYLAFLAVLKNLLPGKSISIAAPASYWYLKGFPIKEISKLVDYIVFMTYDLHGQWDAQNQNAQIGCPSGMCLRSNVNLTETISSLVMITKAGVPSNQVVVGVTSYGRSYGMADAGCHTPDCFYTGTPLLSDAAKGVCTGTAGYIADAEIYDILKDSSRVNHHYVDPTSNTNILVYDNIQWVGYMSPEIRASRTTLYKSLNMGGTTNWAIDLESYNDPPSRVESWSDFLTKLEAGGDPYQLGERHGNWTSLTCADRAVADIRNLSPSDRWNMLDCPDAWQDVIDVWKKYDRPKAGSDPNAFVTSIGYTLHGPQLADCGALLGDHCGQTITCNVIEGPSTGPAGYEIYNSLVIVHDMYKNYRESLINAAASTINPVLQDFEQKFAPVPAPPDDTRWLLFLIDLLTLGTASIAGPFFNSFLGKMPYFAANPATLNNLKDTTLTAITQSTTIAKDLYQKPTIGVGKWTEEKQKEFSHYLGQTIYAWNNITAVALRQLFDGSDSSIEILTSIISDGKCIDGKSIGPHNYPPKDAGDVLLAIATKSFFAFAIPNIWHVSGTFPFIIDSGYDCSAQDPLTKYLSVETMRATFGCVDNRLYYLASPKGDAQIDSEDANHVPIKIDNMFSAPPGINWLDGKSFGSITVADLIKGSVRTYKQNGNMNGGKSADTTDPATARMLLDDDVTSPGFIRMPVCSPDIAFNAWVGVHGKPDTTADNYPCTIQLAKSHCDSSTFEDQTSGASPPVSDCLQIVKNIQGTGGEWEVENALGQQHQLVQFGKCRFGVQGKGKDGNVDFHVGAQDIIDIINDSVKRFGGSGKVGSTGTMQCRGTVKKQNVEWGLY